MGLGFQEAELAGGGSGQEGIDPRVSLDPRVDGTVHLDSDLKMEAQKDSGSVVVKDSEVLSHSAWRSGSEVGKNSKPSPHLGILQKDLKKGGVEKVAKLGRKKDLEKIKLIGENLVDSGSVKTLDSHFASHLK